LDNNGARFLAFKAGSNRIKHMRGKYLWLQQLVEDGSLEVEKISTTTNSSDLGTKGLTRNRMMALMYIIGFVDESLSSFGEKEYQEMMMTEVNKQRIKQICMIVASEHDHDRLHLGSQVTSSTMRTSSVQLAKRVLAITALASLMQFGTAFEMGKHEKEQMPSINEITVQDVTFLLICMWLYLQSNIQYVNVEGEVEKVNVWKIVIGLFSVVMFGYCFCTYMIEDVEYMIQHMQNYTFVNMMEYTTHNIIVMKYLYYMMVIIAVVKLSKGLSLAICVSNHCVEADAIKVDTSQREMVKTYESDLTLVTVRIVSFGICFLMWIKLVVVQEEFQRNSAQGEQTDRLLRSTDVNVSRFAPAITFLAERIAEQNRIRRMNRSEEKDEDEDDSPEPAPSDAASSP
jgi:hypothetical protein